jgi:cation:H+ antiporter
MEYFLILYAVAITASFLGGHPVIKTFIAMALFLTYGGYVFKTLKGDGEPEAHEIEEAEIDPCYFAPKSHDPHMTIIGIQVLSSLLLIVWGSYIFVEKVQIISELMGISPFILAMIIAPIATELPEKFNSVIWIGKGKDTLAIGNVTGAMVFQGSMITGIGILMTDWRLNTAALLTVALTFASVGLAYLQIRIKKHLTPGTLLVGGFFYFLFLLLIVTGKI